MLAKLAADNEHEVVAAAAQHPSCPLEVLRALSRRFEQARRGVATNPNCPPELLRRLAEDPDWRVRRRVAGNSNCPSAMLNRLQDDTSGQVRATARH